MICVLFIAGCGEANVIDSLNVARTEGRIMIWHGWDEEGQAAIDALVEQYNTIHPDITVVVVNVPVDELHERFQDAAVLGLGPDLLLGPSQWLQSLYEQNLLAPMSKDQIDVAKFSRATLNLGVRDQMVYGLPLTIQTPALYYNKELVTDIPNLYEGLLDAADQGHVVAINTKAAVSFAGIDAFGSPLIEEIENEQVPGQVLRLNPDGFLAWLAWLRQAQENRNVILSQDQAALFDLFRRGQVSYYLGTYQDFLDYRALGLEGDADILGIATLPSGEVGISRPLLQGEMLYFNHASSERQKKIALEFAIFLTNSEQSNALLRQINIVPANQRVRVGRGVYPDVYPFAQAGRFATTIPVELESVIIGTVGDTVYTAILSGAQTPEATFCEWQTKVAASWEGLILSTEFCQYEEAEE